MESIHMLGSSKEGRLLSKSGLKGCLFNGTYLGKTPKIPSVPMEGLPPGVCFPAVWPSKCPKSVHKTIEASAVSPKAEGHSANSLPRRLLDNGKIETTCTSTCSNNIEHSGGVGICNKLSKVPVNTFPTNRIPRVHGELSKHEFKSPQRQTQESPKS